MRHIDRSPALSSVLVALVALMGVAAWASQSPPKPLTTTTLVLAAGPEEPDPDASPWMLTATVVATEASSATPLGLVEFMDDSRSLGTALLIITDAGVTATLGVNNFAEGLHALTAHYLGDATFAASLSGPVMHSASDQ